MLQRLQVTMSLDRPRDEVFGFFADAGNLAFLTPPELNFEILTPLPVAMHQGTLISYRLRLFGVPFAWQSLISRWEPPVCFVDEQLQGPYRQWVHTHRFHEVSGGTEIVDQVEYRLPLAPLSATLQWLVSRQLKRIFQYRQQQLEKIFPPDPGRRDFCSPEQRG
jgi:ligand-binding SRPBCC domain-containing protein